MVSISTNDLIVTSNKHLYWSHFKSNELIHSFLLKKFKKRLLHLFVYSCLTFCITCLGSQSQQVPKLMLLLFKTVTVLHESMTIQQNYFLSRINFPTCIFNIPLSELSLYGRKSSYLKSLLLRSTPLLVSTTIYNMEILHYLTHL